MKASAIDLIAQAATDSRNGLQRAWQNMPADRHSQGSVFSYADGPAARKSWRWPKKLGDLEWDKPVANDRDLRDLLDLQETIPQ